MKFGVSGVTIPDRNDIPGRYTIAHVPAVVQRNDKTANTAVFGVDKQSCPNNSNCWKASWNGRRHEPTGAYLRINVHQSEGLLT